MSLSEQFTTLKAAIAVAENELNLLNSGKKASAPRLRRSLQNIKNQSQLIRKATTSHVKTLPIKKRTHKITPESFDSSRSEPEPEPEPVECLQTQTVEPVECLQTQTVEPTKKKRTKNKKVLFV